MQTRRLCVLIRLFSSRLLALSVLEIYITGPSLGLASSSSAQKSCSTSLNSLQLKTSATSSAVWIHQGTAKFELGEPPGHCLKGTLANLLGVR